MIRAVMFSVITHKSESWSASFLNIFPAGVPDEEPEPPELPPPIHTSPLPPPSLFQLLLFYKGIIYPIGMTNAVGIAVFQLVFRSGIYIPALGDGYYRTGLGMRLECESLRILFAKY